MTRLVGLRSEERRDATSTPPVKTDRVGPLREKWTSAFCALMVRLRFVLVVLPGLGVGLWSVGVHAQNEPGKVGAPQVLEIPVQRPTPHGPGVSDSLSSAEWPGSGEVATYHEPSWLARGDSFPRVPDPSSDEFADRGTTSGRPTYLGVLYATAEEGRQGVRVLNVIEGSPAARAGFEGVNAAARDNTDRELIELALAALAISPAGPFVMPLAVAYNLYKQSNPPGDLIVSVEDTTIRNAQEFTQAMQRFEPGDSVRFKVLRRNQVRFITVTLQAEPF